jgi:hypothetical protein
MLLAALVVEFIFRALALLVTVEVAHTLTSNYVDALKEATRAYLTIIELLYTQNRRRRR